MDPKLTMLFVLIGVVIALTHLSEENLVRVRRQLAGSRWRNLVAGRRRA